MKTINELIDTIENLCPDLKSSQKCFLAGLMQSEYESGFKDGMETAKYDAATEKALNEEPELTW